MNDYPQLLADYVASVHFPHVSGFEVLELLDVRSRLALAESHLSASEKEQLEEADEILLMHAREFHERVADIRNLCYIFESGRCMQKTIAIEL